MYTCELCAEDPLPGLSAVQIHSTQHVSIQFMYSPYIHTHACACIHTRMHARMHAHTPYTHTHTVMSPQLGDTFGINDEYGAYSNTFHPVVPHSNPDPYSHLIPHSHPNPHPRKRLAEDSISLCGMAGEREAEGFEKEGDGQHE